MGRKRFKPARALLIDAASLPWVVSEVCPLQSRAGTGAQPLDFHSLQAHGRCAAERSIELGIGAGMRSVRMVETPLVFARLTTLFLLACAEPPDSAQSPSTRMIRPNLASPAASSPKNDRMPLMPLMTSSSNLGIPTPIPPPKTAPKDILIYGPSLLGAPDNEATLAAAAGHNVTVADPVTWSAMTTADFAQYRAIVFS